MDGRPPGMRKTSQSRQRTPWLQPVPRAFIAPLWPQSVRRSARPGWLWSRSSGFHPPSRFAAESDHRSAQSIVGCGNFGNVNACAHDHVFAALFATLQQPVTTVNQFALHGQLSRSAMSFYRAGSVDVHHFMPVRQQPVRNQHAMAAEVYALGTHIGNALAFGDCNQFSDRLLELRISVQSA